MKHTSFAALTSAALMASSAIASAQQVITFNIFLPPSHYMWEVIPAWAAEVEAATEGRVEIEIPASSLAPPPEQLAAVRTGIADAAVMASVFLTQQAPVANMGLLPFMTDNNVAAATIALQHTYDRYLSAANEFPGVEVLSTFHLNYGTFCSLNDQPIQSVADIAGRRMWALPGTPARLLEQLGISFVAGPAVGIHEYVSRNVVDGFVGINYDSITGFNVGPYTRSCTLTSPDVFSVTFVMFVNSRVWSAISPTDQAAIRALSGEAFGLQVAEAVDRTEAAAQAELQGLGVSFYQASPEFVAELQTAAEPLVAEWLAAAAAAGVDGQAALDYYRAERQAASSSGQ